MITDAGPQAGGRFSKLYLTPPHLGTDSLRARTRVSALLRKLQLDQTEIAEAIEREHGVSVPMGMYAYLFDSFIAGCELRDFLDLVTTVLDVIGKTDQRRSIWISEIRRIFLEEHLAYDLDNLGNVRRKIDEEFHRNLDSTIRALSSERYRSVRTEVERSQEFLCNIAPSNKLAVRATFEAAETVYKLMFPNSPRLASNDLQGTLGVVLGRQYGHIDLRSSMKMMKSFGDWVDAAHFFRHSAGAEEPTEPRLSLTVLLISTGFSFIRWLAEIDDTTFQTATDR
ncbi:hypothetical protein ABEG18_12535 [Alsobacter sp. KACC 23698]|uniref:TIGR02391 family protein n=1 Tax=Alsobacter sp. KACC 23698 TaxID=3149229 RepID=A0AAU7JMW6_9HYPH